MNIIFQEPKQNLQKLTKEEQYSQVLQSAINSDKPLYRMTKKELDRELGRSN